MRSVEGIQAPDGEEPAGERFEGRARDKVMSPGDQKDLREKYDMAEEAIGRDMPDRLERLAESIEKKTLTP